MNHWHVHSHYSALDGLSKVDEIVNRAKEIGSKVACITDHASISSLPELFKKAPAAGLKPAIGCEFYVADRIDGDNMKEVSRYHLTVIAKTWAGVESLMAQLSLANNQFYRRPLLSFDQAMEFHDCVVGTACTFGVLSHPDYRAITDRLLAAYGDDLYLEIMPHVVILEGESHDRQRIVNERAIRLAAERSIKLLATNDSHYTLKADGETQKVLLAVQYNKRVDEWGGWGNDAPFFMRTLQEMIDAYKALGYLDAGHISQAMLNSVYLAEKIDTVRPKFEVHLPQVHDDDDLYARQILKRGWDEKINYMVGGNAKTYYDRLVYELQVIKKMGFMKYFLMVEDIIRWSRSQGIMVGPGRGSAAGSLVCYLMDITQLDPIKHGLYFERFLNPERVNLPDIDVDFQDNRRHEVVEYIVGKYGVDCVSQINTFGKMSVKSAFRDVCRTFGINAMEVNNLSKQLEDADSFTSVPELSAFASKYPGIVRHTNALDGTIRQQGVHACMAGESKLLTVGGYRTLAELDGLECDIMTSQGVRRARIFCSGVRDIYELNFATSKYSSGKPGLLVTNDHLVGFDGGYIEAERAVGMRVGTKQAALDDMLFAAGWFWNDGCYNWANDNGYVCFTSGMDEQAKDVFKRLGAIGDSQAGRPDRFLLTREFVRDLQALAGDGFKVATKFKTAPYLGTMQARAAWLRGFMSANATVQRGCIRLKISSELLLNEIEEMLAMFGITGSRQMVNGKVCSFANGDYQCADAYNLEISVNGAFIYGHLIGFAQEYKQERIGRHCYTGIKYIRTDKVYDFSVLTNDELCRNGYVDGLNVHNCGICISSTPMKEVCVLEKRKDAMVCNWDMRDCESFGLLKMDALGLTTLSILDHARKQVEKNYGASIDYPSLPLEDQETMRMFSRGEGTGIFQFEGGKMQELLRRLEAKDFATITATTALYRPGPLQAGLTDRFVRIARGEEYESYACPQLEPILKPTRSIMIYQEQIMRIFSELGGFTWAQADQMRKIIGKKLGKDEFDKHRASFVDGCAGNGIDTKVADSLFTDMAEFASYSFNLAHAAAYTVVSVWCMYMKAHYTAEFLAAYMSCVKSDDSVGEMVAEAKRLGIAVDRPHINLSTDIYELDDGHIIAPLQAIKGVGEKAVESILAARQDSVFLSVADMQERVNRRVVNKRVVEILGRAGAMESLGEIEPDHEQREKNYAELLPMFNEIPAMSLDRDTIDEKLMPAIQQQIADFAEEINKTPLMPEYGSNPVILAINMPLKGETKLLGKPSTKLFSKTLVDLGITRKSWYYTSILKAVYDTPSKASKPSISAGLEIVKQEIVAVEPKLIICFANNAIPLFVPDGKMSKLNGKVVYNKTYDCYVLFSWSPQYASYKDAEIGPLFFDNMAKVCQIFEGCN